jgi:inorganic pyrophosphatase
MGIVANTFADGRRIYLLSVSGNKTTFDQITPFDEHGLINVIIDTPRGSQNKYAFNHEHGLFKLSGLLTAGHTFPFDFGFIPNTVNGDDDNVDVLVLTDEPTFTGCWTQCRLIGGYAARQAKEGQDDYRNDRLLAIEKHSLNFGRISEIAELDETLVEQIEHFYVSYNESKGKKFEVIKLLDAEEAADLVRECIAKSKA